MIEPDPRRQMTMLDMNPARMMSTIRLAIEAMAFVGFNVADAFEPHARPELSQ
jgi:hypothetical protein